uniref:Uncharacterized protein n=1 Tax=Romanomermis culicivorax TaxID=13658 RepID=A0A915J063_ROMCU
MESIVHFRTTDDNGLELCIRTTELDQHGSNSQVEKNFMSWKPSRYKMGWAQLGVEFGLSVFPNYALANGHAISRGGELILRCHPMLLFLATNATIGGSN